MSDTILSGRWKVYYLSEERQKRVERDTSVTPAVIDDIKDVYTALSDLFDEYNQMDDGTVMKYATPTEYTIGKIDTGDADPWFIDMQSVEYLKEGALETSGWKRVQDSNTGIVRVLRSGTNIVAGDIGLPISHADGDTGTLLDVQGTYLWIRPTDETSTHNWDSTSGNITCNAHIDTQDGEAASTGELLWANIYSIGSSLDGDGFTHLYVYQDGSKLSAYKGSWNWWDDGHIDILVQVKDPGAGASALIDEGYVTVYPRRYSQQYDNYIVDLSAGGRNPIPLAVGDDINNDTGYSQVTLGTSSGNWVEGDEIEGKVSGALGIVTGTSGSNPSITVYYYLIGDLTDFNGSEGIQNNDDTGDSSTSGATSDYGPALLVGPSITHANNNSYDINEDGTNEYYSIVIDCNNEALSDVYEWTKYILRRGSVDTGNNDGVNGEAYIGTTYNISYTTLNNTVSEGDVVTQLVSGATGTVVAHHTGPKILILRDTRGTFNNTNNIEVDGSNYVTGPTCTSISPNKASPYGTFAGGRWFCAPGVVLVNVPTADYNNWQTTDDERTARSRPIKVDVTVGNTREGDRIAVWRLDTSGGIIQKDTYTIDAAQETQGGYGIKADASIGVDEPGKTAGGKLRVVDDSAGWEHRYRYTSWSSDTFNLFTLSGTATGGSQTSIVDSGADFINDGVQLGDIVLNDTENTYGYVTATGTTTLTMTNTGSDNPVTDWNADDYVVGVTVSDYTTSDTVYVPFIDTLETVGTDGSPGSESVQIVYDASVPARCRVRSAGDIIPFVADFTIGSSGGTINVIRNVDAVHGT